MRPPLHLTIAGVCERDLDLFFLEELASSADFSRWFLAQTMNDVGAATLVDVRRSVTQSTGESDLEATFEGADGSRLRLLIENKIDAGLQVDQAQRYQQRAADYVAQRRCALARTVLVAPARYFGGDDTRKGFDARLTYEQVLDRINDTELGARAHYKRALLGAAIEKGTLGYQPEADAPVTAFWRAYWRMARELAPELDMAEPIAKPARAGFISLRSPTFPRGVEICHKLPHGNVDLQFGGWGERMAEFRQVIEPLLAPGMTVARAAKSASIRLRVAPLNTARGFSEQEAEAVEGVRAAGVLLSWWGKHKAALTRLVA